MPATFLPSFSVCIRTCNRPDDLRLVLASVQASTMPPHEVIVSDDSRDYVTRQLMRESFPAIVYREGPRRCAAANRNQALAVATGTHVLFLDDDTTLGPTFLQQMADRLADDYVYRVAAGGDPARLILTGTGLRGGERLRPRAPSFLGYPRAVSGRGEPLSSLLLSSTVFPRALFARLQFDERLAAEYDVIDLADRAVCNHGCRVELLPSAANAQPCAPQPAGDGPAADASRMFTMLRHYGRRQRRRTKAAVFVMSALAQNLARNLRCSGWRGVRAFGMTTHLLWDHLHPRPDDAIPDTGIRLADERGAAAGDTALQAVAEAENPAGAGTPLAHQ